MKKIRIGNDITFRIAVTRLGASEDFSTRKLTLLLRSALATVKLDYTIADNVLTAVWYGTEQSRTGCYTVTLVENYGTKSRNTVDSCGVFALVARSCEESGALTGDQIIDLDLDVTVPANGLTAYEIALLNGFEGTQEEWQASLVGEVLYPTLEIDDKDMCLYLVNGSESMSKRLKIDEESGQLQLLNTLN